MSKFNLSISFDSIAELEAMFAKLTGKPQVIETKVEFVEQPISETPIEEVKRRGRPAKKIEAQAEPVLETKQEVQPETVDEFADLEDKPQVTKQMVSDSLMAFGKKFGRKAMDDLLMRYNAPTFQKLSIDSYSDVVLAANNAVARGSI